LSLPRNTNEVIAAPPACGQCPTLEAGLVHAGIENAALRTRVDD